MKDLRSTLDDIQSDATQNNRYYHTIVLAHLGKYNIGVQCYRNFEWLYGLITAAHQNYALVFIICS